ncbi:hypothetical protein BCR33DRAFT_716330 [Rhizoclosmatium globosum]|uniref:Uncharacterized protein n=1 Tax=Rhizoclosmatium globosum TaxID=329046 RepID=A0A1Y2CFI4_9FUNG|nr:hypothetical protein BCR33DRAFT_716330 [Rhizoclosmatium globosum]|eukprot:ORY45686.1 hypothetical protein BCR33DRAFT_716330 [Rhizoclosmatium globosum]
MFKAPSTAILRNLSPSFTKCVTNVDLSVSGAIDMAKAHEQHNLYAEAVKECVSATVEVEADANHPDCCFVEDTLVVCDNVVVVNSLGHESRRGEVGPVRKALEQIPSIKSIHNMSDVPDAFIDGGDVLTMPRHQFVGLSKRSNVKGVEYLRSVFGNENMQVHAIDMKQLTGTTLHLKCLVSGLDQNTIVVADNASGRAVFDEIQRVSENAYKAIYVPDEVAANVLSFPWAKQPTAIIQAGFPESEKILREKIPAGWKIVTLNMSELIKADGALTCCSVLI